MKAVKRPGSLDWLCGGDRLLPSAAIGGGTGKVHEILRESAVRERYDDFDRGLGALAGLGACRTTSGRLDRRESPACPQTVREETHIVGMIGDDEEVQWPRQLRWLPRGRGNLFASGEAIGVLGAQPRPEGTGIHRKGGVEMGIAEQRAGRKFAAGIGRIGGLERLLGRSLSNVPASCAKAGTPRLMTTRQVKAVPCSNVFVISFLPRTRSVMMCRVAGDPAADLGCWDQGGCATCRDQYGRRSQERRQDLL